MPDQPKTIGQLLRYLRRQAGLTLGDVARACDVSVVNISAAERLQHTALSSYVAPKPSAAQITVYIATERSLHPYGKCTCHGEGHCEWHQGICETCLGEGLHPSGTNIPCEDCDGSGRKNAEADWKRAEEQRLALETKLLYDARNRDLKTPPNCE